MEKAIKMSHCRFCSVSFKKLEHCQRHERTHTLDRPYSCATCSKTFARQDTLNRHARLHVRKAEGYVKPKSSKTLGSSSKLKTSSIPTKSKSIPTILPTFTTTPTTATPLPAIAIPTSSPYAAPYSSLLPTTLSQPPPPPSHPRSISNPSTQIFPFSSLPINMPTYSTFPSHHPSSAINIAVEEEESHYHARGRISMGVEAVERHILQRRYSEVNYGPHVPGPFDALYHPHSLPTLPSRPGSPRHYDFGIKTRETSPMSISSAASSSSSDAGDDDDDDGDFNTVASSPFIVSDLAFDIASTYPSPPFSTYSPEALHEEMIDLEKILANDPMHPTMSLESQKRATEAASLFGGYGHPAEFDYTKQPVPTPSHSYQNQHHPRSQSLNMPSHFGFDDHGRSSVSSTSSVRSKSSSSASNSSSFYDFPPTPLSPRSGFESYFPSAAPYHHDSPPLLHHLPSQPHSLHFPSLLIPNGLGLHQSQSQTSSSLQAAYSRRASSTSSSAMYIPGLSANGNTSSGSRSGSTERKAAFVPAYYLNSRGTEIHET